MAWVATAPTPGQRPGDDRADREPVRLDGDAELAGLRVAGHDRVGHGPTLLCKPSLRVRISRFSGPAVSAAFWPPRSPAAGEDVTVVARERRRRRPAAGRDRGRAASGWGSSAPSPGRPTACAEDGRRAVRGHQGDNALGGARADPGAVPADRPAPQRPRAHGAAAGALRRPSGWPRVRSGSSRTRRARARSGRRVRSCASTWPPTTRPCAPSSSELAASAGGGGCSDAYRDQRGSVLWSKLDAARARWPARRARAGRRSASSARILSGGRP